MEKAQLEMFKLKKIIDAPVEEPALCFIDVETTGDDKKLHHLLQIAVIITDIKFNVIEEYETPIYQNKETMYNEANNDVKKMHSKTGLWDRVETEGKMIEQVDAEVREMLEEIWDGQWNVKIWGNSVFFDNGFIQEYLPKSGELLGHQVVDVSSVLSFFRTIDDKVETNKLPTTHDALDDIRKTIDQARRTKSLVKNKNLPEDEQVKLY